MLIFFFRYLSETTRCVNDPLVVEYVMSRKPRRVAQSPSMADYMDGNAANSALASTGWNFIVLMSRQGKIRLSEFFSSYSESEKKRILRDIQADILPRAPKMCNIIEKGAYKFVYRRYGASKRVIWVFTVVVWHRMTDFLSITRPNKHGSVMITASLYFVVGVPQGMNELIALEQIHLFVEALDGYFNSGTYWTVLRFLAMRDALCYMRSHCIISTYTYVCMHAYTR